ncbi:hypothetical protein N7456_009140 [Penicillium angulare]|uniref:F-box domain-containing protein n=1 Tax=Penicillium angulare TaxID=116970 RepID=A0A9W9F462_9EURO|nr:hypothetical protein N7456_009140 [Penicillium angulare]
MSDRPLVFPMEVWWMIVHYLREEKSPQHISRLAQTCKSFHKAMKHFIYQPVRLRGRDNAVRFARIVKRRPDLKRLIKEVRHDGDMGFTDFVNYSDPFYQVLSTLKNMETLVMRPKFRPEKKDWFKNVEQLLYQMYLSLKTDPEKAWEMLIGPLKNILEGEEYLGGPPCTWGDPYGIGWDPLAATANRDHETAVLYLTCDLVDRAYFCNAYLERAPAALRSCHIGTDSLQSPTCQLAILNFSIFELPHLRKLCITGARYDTTNEVFDPDGRMRYLEELTVLNCHIDIDGLISIIEYPDYLKSFTLRGPNYSNSLDPENDEYTKFAELLNEFHSKNLKSLDLDIYWGTKVGINLNRMISLNNLTVTPYSVVGVEAEATAGFSDALPPSLQKLTLRHEEGAPLPISNLYESISRGDLQQLREIVCQIPETIEDGQDKSKLRSELGSWKNRFQELEVQLDVVLVPYPLTMPNYDACSCENLEFYHRFPFHPRPPGTSTTEDEA